MSGKRMAVLFLLILVMMLFSDTDAIFWRRRRRRRRRSSSSPPPTPPPLPPPTPPRSSRCPLFDYKGSNFDPNGWYKFVRIENGFKQHAVNINRYAGDCGVKLFITSSFRKHIPSGGSSRSNHMAGRAIDLNLSWPGGFCNKSCMRNEIRLPSRAKCFITKIRNDRSLRWGGDFNDPGHIDDNLNNRDRATYNRLRNRLQPICRKP